MILSLEQAKEMVGFPDGWTDESILMKLSAIESFIREYTNNNFQARAFRCVAVAVAENNTLMCNTVIPFKVGDTLQISESELQPNALVTVTAVSKNTITVKEELFDESGVLVTKVVYPADVRVGAVNLIKWDLESRAKVGIASETISRHSVTYLDQSGDNSTNGYPKALTGFLMPYRKARFGGGCR